MEKWVDNDFVSSSVKTDEFKSFSRDFIKKVKKTLGNEYVVNLSPGHFYVSGFITKDGDKFVYLSISDVRHFKDEWLNHILVRSAKNDRDYTGGANGYSTLDNLKTSVEKLLG